MAKNKKLPPRKEKARRKFIRTVAMGIGVVGISLLGYLPVLGRWHKRIRPPGALKEQEFLASCIKCGQCVQVCPVNAIKLADLDEGFGIGTPYIDTRAQACDFSCDGLQCVLACPTGSLTHRAMRRSTAGTRSRSMSIPMTLNYAIFVSDSVRSRFVLISVQRANRHQEMKTSARLNVRLNWKRLQAKTVSFASGR